MILRCLSDRLYLVRGKPFFQVRILPDYPAGRHMVHFPAVNQTGVVESGGGIENVLVNVIVN